MPSGKCESFVQMDSPTSKIDVIEEEPRSVESDSKDEEPKLEYFYSLEERLSNKSLLIEKEQEQSIAAATEPLKVLDDLVESEDQSEQDDYPSVQLVSNDKGAR